MRKELNGIEYQYIDPNGNITALVESDVAISEHTATADLIMREDKKVEQVGFIRDTDKADTGLRMAAGEFCGNATMSAAALFCDKTGLGIGSRRSLTVDSSGCPHPIEVNITREENSGNLHVFCGSVCMPQPRKISQHTFEYDGVRYDLPLVDFDGISHIIAIDGPDFDDEKAEEAIKKWINDINVEGLGIIFVTPQEGSGYVVRPLVYVPAVGTCYWESSCASGTTAAAAYMFSKGMVRDRLTATEPGGMLTVDRGGDGKLILSGRVMI